MATNPYSPDSPRTISLRTERESPEKLDAILSSWRPVGQNPSYDEHQRTALESWFAVSRSVVLFNLPSDTGNIQRPGLIYVGPNSNPPSIKEMLGYLKASDNEKVVALVNSDIILTRDIAKIPLAAQRASLGLAWTCLSLRQVIDPNMTTISPPNDYGLDFFCSPARIWKDVADKIPGVLTFGRIVWDNFLNSLLSNYIDKSKRFDITDWKAVLHPQHDDHFRLGNPPGVDEIVKNISGGGIPALKIKLPQ